MSNKIIKFAGFDPSLRNFGIVTGSLNLDTAEVTDVSIKLIETEATQQKKKTVRTNSDDLRRANEIWRGIKPIVDSVNIVFAELPVVASPPAPKHPTACASVFWRVSINLLFS